MKVGAVGIMAYFITSNTQLLRFKEHLQFFYDNVLIDNSMPTKNPPEVVARIDMLRYMAGWKLPEEEAEEKERERKWAMFIEQKNMAPHKRPTTGRMYHNETNMVVQATAADILRDQLAAKPAESEQWLCPNCSEKWPKSAVVQRWIDSGRCDACG